MRTLLWYPIFAVTLFLTAPLLLIATIRKKSMPERDFLKFTEFIVRQWALIQVRTSGARFHMAGMENIPDEAVLFISNHQSNFDIAVFLALIAKPKGFVAKIEILKVPVLRTWMKYINCVFLNRKDLRQSAKTILEGIRILKSGHSMVVFPEGTRSKGDSFGEFKAGSYKLATKSKVPIVPVTINGTYKIMEANKNRIKPADVYITIHPPIATADLNDEELAALPARVEGIIRATTPKPQGSAPHPANFLKKV
ncbi:MAG: 1-acyl-sn-glycerol-3-phosphate acyltransferase [Defluviitaleaceae bacterium]|nr:1-acyl-sn-glycerol-3-phosphate acyltransferase [Defluviitaleaceae bacterium]